MTAASFLLPLLGRFSGRRGAAGGAAAAPALPVVPAPSRCGCCTRNVACIDSDASGCGCCDGGFGVVDKSSAAGCSASAMRLLKCGCLASAVSRITDGRGGHFSSSLPAA